MHPLLSALHGASRRKKQRLFDALLSPALDATVLNVGASGAHVGLPDQFETRARQRRIVGGGLGVEDVRDYAACFPWARAVVFDGCALPFADASFDVAYSNAVVEHLPSWDLQMRFASEIQRVARSWFVTTPNLMFVVDPHYHLPLVQFLPQARQQQLVRALGRQPYPHLNLLSRRRFQQLFPTSRIIGCRVTLYAETLIACGRAVGARHASPLR